MDLKVHDARASETQASAPQVACEAVEGLVEELDPRPRGVDFDLVAALEASPPAANLGRLAGHVIGQAVRRTVADGGREGCLLYTSDAADD